MSGPESKLDEALHAWVFNEEIIARERLLETGTQQHPRAVILAGQPGAGKGGLAEKALHDFEGDAVVVDPDRLRAAHPKVEQLRERYPYTWAEHTHADASAWAKELRAAAIDGKKNLILDTTLGNGAGAVSLIRELKEKATRHLQSCRSPIHFPFHSRTP